MAVADVLLVDDEREAVVLPIMAAFHTANILVDTAGTWDEALDQFLVGGHSLVLADWNLPGSRNGLALLAELKLLRPNTRLVLFSGFLDEDQRAKAEELAFVDRALPKGVNLVEELIAEAIEAQARSSMEIDWRELARRYDVAAQTDMDAVEELEQILRTGAS